MAKEPVPDASAIGGAFDQAGNVGQHEFAVLVGHDTELGDQGGEGVVPDLGLGVGNLVDERAFARIGQAQEADIGEQL